MRIIREAERLLKEDNLLGIFPQGGVSFQGRIDRIFPGAVYLAYRTNSPLIPIFIKGTYKALRQGLSFYKIKLFLPIRVKVGEPFL